MAARSTVGQRLHDIEGPRPLHREQGVARAGVHGHRVADAGDAVANPLEAGRDVGGIDHEQEVVVGQPVHQQVVDESAFGGRQGRVLRLAGLEPVRVVGRYPLHGGEGVGPRHLDLAHVADVEQPRRPPHGQVLLGNAGVLDGHLPPRERHHLRAQGDVTGMQGGLQPGGSGSVGHDTVRVGSGRGRPGVPARGEATARRAEIAAAAPTADRPCPGESPRLVARGGGSRRRTPDRDPPSGHRND